MSLSPFVTLNHVTLLPCVTLNHAAALKAYAMEQGDMAVRYGVCHTTVWAACGLSAGEARLIRHDLPDTYKESGIRHRYALTDVLKLHIFSRGGACTRT
jgi:hypothetical protein